MANLRRMRPLMGTFVEIAVDAFQHRNLQDVVNKAFNEIETIDRLMSFHQAESELSHLNLTQGRKGSVHPYTYQVLSLAKEMMEQSDGAFNCTVGGFLVREQMLPDLGFGEFHLQGSADDLVLCDGEVSYRKPLLVTLDGIAKGFAIDLAVQTLENNGIQSGWVNAGGDLRVFGSSSTPIHRREKDQTLSYIGHLKNTAVATSSVTENFDERFPGMMIDSSLKVRQGLWTVKAPQAWLADALTKVAAVAHPKQVKALISSLGGEMVYGLSL